MEGTYFAKFKPTLPSVHPSGTASSPHMSGVEGCYLGLLFGTRRRGRAVAELFGGSTEQLSHRATGYRVTALHRAECPNRILVDARQRQNRNFPLGLFLIIGEQGQQLGCRIEQPSALRAIEPVPL